MLALDIVGGWFGHEQDREPFLDGCGPSCWACGPWFVCCRCLCRRRRECVQGNGSGGCGAFWSRKTCVWEGPASRAWPSNGPAFADLVSICCGVIASNRIAVSCSSMGATRVRFLPRRPSRSDDELRLFAVSSFARLGVQHLVSKIRLPSSPSGGYTEVLGLLARAHQRSMVAKWEAKAKPKGVLVPPPPQVRLGRQAPSTPPKSPAKRKPAKDRNKRMETAKKPKTETPVKRKPNTRAPTPVAKEIVTKPVQKLA